MLTGRGRLEAKEESVSELGLKIKVKITELVVRSADSASGKDRKWLEYPGTLYELIADNESGMLAETLSKPELDPYLRGFRAGALMAGCLNVKEEGP